MHRTSPRIFWISSEASPPTLRAEAPCLSSLVSHHLRRGLADLHPRQQWNVSDTLNYGADGDVKLTESAVVAEYVDNAYPDSGPKIFPTAPLKLALVRLGTSSQCMSRSSPCCQEAGIILMLLLDLQVRLFVENFGAVSGSTFKLLGAETKAEVDAAKESFTKALKVSL